MYSPDALLDIHARTHRAFAALIEHVGGFSEEALDHARDGVGTPTLRLQMAHMIGAERYWVGVLEGHVDAEEREECLRTLPELAAARVAVAATTQAYLRASTEAHLNAPRPMTVFGGTRPVLMPAHVILRVTTHVFHHGGQCAMMCRALGRPVTRIDFPLL